MTLKEGIIQVLTGKAVTVPDLCKIFEEEDEFDIMHEIAELQHSNKAFLIGFDTLYREDGGAIYLAKYSNKRAE